MSVEATTHHHHLIMSSRVVHTPVFNGDGERMGHVEDLSIDKVSGQVVYAVLSFGGFLGIGEKFHPIPWSMLDYDPARLGFVVPLEKKAVEHGPTLSRDELEELGAGDSWRTRIFDYYAKYGAPPYI